MRIGNNTMVERTMRDLFANKIRLANVQRDISTGKRIHRGADDPTGAARAHVLREQIATNDTYLSNVEAARDSLATADEALSRYHDLLLNVREAALKGASGHLQQSEKDVLSRQVTELREQIRMISSTKDATGRYVFGGLKTDVEPYPQGDVTLGPNNVGLMTVEVAQGATITYNVTAVSVFGDTTPGNTDHVFDELDELIGFLDAGTNDRSITNTSIARLDVRIDKLNGMRADVGTRVQRLDLAVSRYEELKVTLDGMLQDTEATDIATASLRLNQYEAAFRASLSVGARALPPSLVDFLR